MTFVTSIGRSKSPEDALMWFLQLSSARPDARWVVTFDGYDDDDREIWDIERCVEICRLFERAGVLGYMAADTAWLFYRIANSLFVPGTCYSVYTDDHVEEFASQYKAEHAPG